MHRTDKMNININQKKNNQVNTATLRFLEPTQKREAFNASAIETISNCRNFTTNGFKLALEINP